MNCTNCGKEITDQEKFCAGCGSPVVSAESTTQPTAQEIPIHNAEQENKVIFILSYILFFLPLVSCPNSKIGRFHANQGLLLLITSVAGGIAVAILSAILMTISFSLWTIPSLLYFAWSVVIAVLAIIGMISANKGEQKPLPVIGKFTLIK